MYKEIIKNLNLLKKNYRGEYISVIGGVVFIIITILCWYILYLFNFINYDFINRHILITVIVGMTGLLDDIQGNKNAQGFKGHFKSLLKGKLTTGIIKIIVISLVTIIVLYKPGKHSFSKLSINSGIIILMTNLLNLLDLRPGRSLKFFILISLFLILTNLSPLVYFFPYYFTLLLYLPFEMKGRIMLGDSGANLLGAVLGYNIILGIKYIYFKVFILLLLLILNLISEKFSFSLIIEKSLFLRWFDRLGRGND